MMAVGVVVYRYAKIADSSKNYIITQYGISCFEQTGEQHKCAVLACHVGRGSQDARDNYSCSSTGAQQPDGCRMPSACADATMLWCAVSFAGPHTYEASTFNFFVFPQPHGTYCRR